jgi:transposase
MRTLAERLVSDELWAIVRPLLPRPPCHPRGGRPRTVADRACMAGIVFMTVTSTPWRLLPARELGCGSPATCWRRFTEWAEAGVFDRLHLQLLDELGRRGLVDWSRVAIDTFSLRAKRGGPRWRKPVDRGKPRSKLHLVVDALGLPLAVALTAASVHDSRLLEAMLDDLPSIGTPSGRRRCRPGKLYADKAYDLPRCRAYLRRRGITARIARRGIEPSVRLGRQRWRVERSLSWLSCYRRLQVRWDRCSGRFFAFVEVACALVCLRALG